MIIVMQPDAGDAEMGAVDAKIRAHGLRDPSIEPARESASSELVIA